MKIKWNENKMNENNEIKIKNIVQTNMINY